MRAPGGTTTLLGTAVAVAVSRLKIAPPSPTVQPRVLLVPQTPLKVPRVLSIALDQLEPFVLISWALLAPLTSRFVVLEAHTAFKSALFAEVCAAQEVPLPFCTTPPPPTAQMFVVCTAKTALSWLLVPEVCAAQVVPFQ